VVAYQALIAFANKTITEENWKAVLHGLVFVERPSRRPTPRLIPPLDLLPPARVDEQPITLESVRRVHTEVRKDLERLTDPTQNVLSPESRDSIKHLGWLSEKMLPLFTDANPITITLRLDWHGKNKQSLLELLGPSSTEPVSLHLDIVDLRHWMYFCLALIWANGWLPRLGTTRATFFVPEYALRMLQPRRVDASTVS
jgi:hypothetical protein